MTKKYKQYNPNQSFLLPPDIRDWLPENHLSFFINDTVDTLDLSEIYNYYESSERGQPPYNPSMMVKVILYAYCVGKPGSRRIEKALMEEVAFRILGAGNHPDFRTISDFRKLHITALSGLFIQILKLCRKAGLVDNNIVSLDGTKVQANANLDKNRDYETLSKDEEELRKRIEADLRKAIEIDEKEDALYGRDKRGDEMPDWMSSKKERLARIRKAMEEIEREQKEKHDGYEEKLDDRARKEKKSGSKLRGRKPNEVPLIPDDDKKANTTDPESRIMKSSKGFVQGYNAQVAVDTKHQVVVAYDVVQDRNDSHQLVPMANKIKENLGKAPKKMTTDAGYWNESEIRKIQDKIELFIATNKDWKERKALRELPTPKGRIPENMSLKDRMERKLRTLAGRAVYKLRGKTIEPTFGQIKEARGFRRFLLRGLRKVTGEYGLIVTTANILKLWRYGPKPATG
jgi:transposase